MIDAEPVAGPFKDFDWMRDDDGVVHIVTGWNKDQRKDMPGIGNETTGLPQLTSFSFAAILVLHLFI
ncbi:hypothetical protein PZB21_25830 [Rhizobium sp. CBK13]|uniref:hypothetical protein n=1 Tax=Rhizobium sp. CBK13 TaxID=3031399 RepID=UPI0023AEDC9C|nr:hypothetical protein [Rhizobium sp. CBK13]MDE8762596.1 hypothetical protein [Rhizobium sp. CBK13]